MDDPNPYAAPTEDVRPGEYASRLLKRSVAASLALMWPGIVAIPIGTFLQQRSPQYEAYYREAVAKVQRQNPGAEVGPSMFVGRVFAVPFAGCFSVFIGLLFTGGLAVLRSLARSHRALALMAASVSCAGCLLGAVLGIGNAWGSLWWGFVVLGLGLSASALGLLLGGVCGVIMCLTGGGSGPAAQAAEPDR